jgi:hypothetical protein
MGKTINIQSAGDYITPVETDRTTLYMVNGQMFHTYGHAHRAALAHLKATTTNNSRRQ